MFFPILHGTADGPFLTAWSFNPLVTAGLLIAAGGYFLALRQSRLSGRRPPGTWQVVAFYIGLATTALALLGPLDTFNDELFFLHMLQHLALMQIAAPLLLLGRPVQLVLRALPPRRSGPVLKTVLRPQWVRLTLTVLTAPVVATLLYNFNLSIWHVPAFYNAALESDLIHELEHMAFFGFSLLFWWPIIEPIPRHHKTKQVWALAAVFVSMVFGIGIGALLTLADGPIYPYYETVSRPWGLSLMADQQIAGLIMWVGGGLLYGGILGGMLIKLLGTGDEPTPAQVERPPTTPIESSPVVSDPA